MSPGTLIIAIISLVICTMPFAFMAINKRKNEKALINKLSTLNDGIIPSLSKYESMVNMIIGLDENNNQLYFYRDVNNRIQKYKIELSDYSDCRIIKINEKDDGNEIDAPIKSIFIQLISKYSKVENLNLEIFDRNQSLGLLGELAFANEWSTLIGEKLRNQIKK